VPTGLAHGTVTAVVGARHFEITTLRRDVETFGRHASVAFTDDWDADAARRDFTINALYADPATRAIHDYFGGVDDLAAGRVRFIGDARERIREDHLRILRYFRFQCRFGSHLDEEAEAACADLAGTLKGLSRERVGWELQNLLKLPDPAATVARMRALGVLQVVLPECGGDEVEALAALIAAERAADVAPDAMRRLAALRPASPPVAHDVAARLRLSRSQRDRLVCAAARDARDREHPRALAYRNGIPCAVDRLLLTGADPFPLREWEVPELPLKGGEIVARGVPAGPEVARILQAVERRWVAEGFPSRARVAGILDEELAHRP
jgi:poly(A) polymerase